MQGLGHPQFQNPGRWHLAPLGSLERGNGAWVDGQEDCDIDIGIKWSMTAATPSSALQVYPRVY